MKKFTKALALLTVLAMTVTMVAGCGNSSNGATDSSTSGDQAAADTFVIGGIGPITGAAAVYGTAVKNGAQLAVDEINAAGGVNGMQLSLNFQDDEHDAEKSVNAYNTLKDKGMKVLMGTVTSTPCIAVAEKSYEDNIFQLSPSGSAVECTQYDNAFRVCFNDPNQGKASAQYIAEHEIATKVAVIYNSSDVYSSGIYEKFAAEAKEQGVEIVTAQAFTEDNNTDFSVQVQKVQESGAELVFLPIYYQEAALILAQADKVGLDVKFFGCDGLDGIIDQLGDDVALAEGVMLLTPFAADAQDEKTVAFTTAFNDAFGETPNQFAADAYDAIYAIKIALEQAEVSDPTIDPSELCDLMKAAMVEISVAGVTGDMTWTADGEPTKTPKAMYISEGSYKAM